MFDPIQSATDVIPASTIVTALQELSGPRLRGTPRTSASCSTRSQRKASQLPFPRAIEVTFSIAAASGNMAKMMYGAEKDAVGNGSGAGAEAGVRG